tara:strand:- start:168 stop:434 length:267 start_codon:yes stop_codon:yes gene_type:complete
MCFGLFRSKTPKPPDLPPAPIPPTPPAAPLPEPDPLESDVNPQIKRAKSKKDKNPLSKGTGALRIPLQNTVNLGQGLANTASPLNIPK